MATATGNYVCDNSSLANFKQWAMAISNAFSVFGWVQTADTGQVNWGAIASVPSNAYVYEIWKSADTLSATLPMFIKMEYGYSGTVVLFRVTVGSGSDLSGAITGQKTAIWYPQQGQAVSNSGYANQGATGLPCYFSGDPGSFRMYLWCSNTLNTGTVFAVERSHDATGADTADYFTALSAGSNNNNNMGNQQSIFPGTVGPREGCWISTPITNTPGTGFWVTAGTVAAFPVFPTIGKLGNPLLGLMVCCISDVGINTTITVTSIYGSTHTYIAGFGPGTTDTNATLSRAFGHHGVGTQTLACLMRYE